MLGEQRTFMLHYVPEMQTRYQKVQSDQMGVPFPISDWVMINVSF